MYGVYLSARRKSDDKDVSFLTVSYNSYGPGNSCVITRVRTSRLSTLELSFGHLAGSIEATISIQVMRGRSSSWPDGSRAVFAAGTASLPDMEVTLLALKDGDRLPVAGERRDCFRASGFRYKLRHAYGWRVQDGSRCRMAPLYKWI